MRLPPLKMHIPWFRCVSALPFFKASRTWPGAPAAGVCAEFPFTVIVLPLHLMRHNLWSLTTWLVDSQKTLLPFERRSCANSHCGRHDPTSCHPLGHHASTATTISAWRYLHIPHIGRPRIANLAQRGFKNKMTKKRKTKNRKTCPHGESGRSGNNSKVVFSATGLLSVTRVSR